MLASNNQADVFACVEPFGVRQFLEHLLLELRQTDPQTFVARRHCIHNRVTLDRFPRNSSLRRYLKFGLSTDGLPLSAIARLPREVASTHASVVSRGKPSEAAEVLAERLAGPRFDAPVTVVRTQLHPGVAPSGDSAPGDSQADRYMNAKEHAVGS